MFHKSFILELNLEPLKTPIIIISLLPALCNISPLEEFCKTQKLATISVTFWLVLVKVLPNCEPRSLRLSRHRNTTFFHTPLIVTLCITYIQQRKLLGKANNNFQAFLISVKYRCHQHILSSQEHHKY